MSDKTVIIQDTWNEHDDIDLLEYINQFNVKTLSRNDILNLDIKDIYKCEVLFCDTSIIQLLINKYIINSLHINKLIPSCYPQSFALYYNRNIESIYLKDLSNIDNYPYPYFVKPFENNKLFEAHIVKNEKIINFY